MADEFRIEFRKDEINFKIDLELSKENWVEFTGYLRDTLNEEGTWSLAPRIIHEMGFDEPSWLEFPTGGDDDDDVMTYTVSRKVVQDVYGIEFSDNQWVQFSGELDKYLSSVAQTDIEYIVFELMELERP